MKSNRATQEPRWVRYTLLTVGLGFLFFFLALPLVAVFAEALAQGIPIYLEAVSYTHLDVYKRQVCLLPCWLPVEEVARTMAQKTMY